MGLDTTLAESGQSPAGNLTEENAFDLIREEIAVMKKLHHPNLVSLVEVLDDPEEDSLFMVLEMCKKGVIMKIEIEQDVDPYTEEECRTWFRDLILGIEYCRSQPASNTETGELTLSYHQYTPKASSIATSSPIIVF